MEKQIKDLMLRANDWLDKTFSPNGKKLFIAILCVMIFAGVLLSVSFFKTGNQDIAELDVIEEEIAPKSEEKSDSDTAEVDIAIEGTGDIMVSIPVEDIGRANPFLPDGEGTVVARPTSMYGYSLMAPPEGLSEGSDAARVMTTKVSGILYDDVKPSAILNIEGNDYLVRTGDYINNYKVLSISKDLVTVQLGKNVYKAGVGQLMTDITLNYNTVCDLQHRFGGAKK